MDFLNFSTPGLSQFIALFSALILGALIGIERQMRQHMAGLRTNALVALGAAGFVVFSGMFVDEVSPTRVAAQVVSGVGFLGAGVIFRNGFTVHGLTTAATLWCASAVGILAGAGHLMFAAMLTSLVLFANFGLRPIVSWLVHRSGASTAQEYELSLTTAAKQHSRTRARIVKGFSMPGFLIKSIENEQNETKGQKDLKLVLSVPGRDTTLFHGAISALLIDPRILSVNWSELS